MTTPRSSIGTALEAERNRFKEALMFTVEAAESWHGDEAAKGRALAVIAEKARLALVEKAV